LVAHSASWWSSYSRIPRAGLCFTRPFHIDGGRTYVSPNEVGKLAIVGLFILYQRYALFAGLYVILDTGLNGAETTKGNERDR